LAEERQSRIVSMVNERGSLSITEIQRRLNVSRETIRRDLVTLSDRNVLRKTHGGALAVERGEPGLAVRAVTNAEAKQAIGLLAADLVPDGASVMLPGGTTVQAVAEALLARQELTVVTNSIAICSRMTGHNGNRVFMLGGEMQTTNNIALGRDATAMLAHYSADFAFIGAGAISPAGWLMDYTREECELSSQMFLSVRTAVVVADHAKFNRYAPVRVEHFEKAAYLVTDRPPDGPLASALAALPLELLVSNNGTR
jgi:DeoR/GlpR family transcriptional regulator of sugar metabolism